MACPYSILCEEVRLLGGFYLTGVVPFDRVKAIYENGNGNELWNSTWQEDWQAQRKKLEQLIPEKCEGESALKVAVYISAFQNGKEFVVKLLQTVSADDYSHWLYNYRIVISNNRFYANVAATYVNAMEETEQNRLVEIIKFYEARALLSLPQNHFLSIPLSLQTKLFNKFPKLAPKTAASPSTPQAPSA
jgi:hypothetical protein